MRDQDCETIPPNPGGAFCCLAYADASVDGANGTLACTTPLDDAGFVSLADLPLTHLCAESASFGYGTLTESVPCRGLTIVVLNDQLDCWWMWAFDAATGAFVADAASCNTSFECTAAPGIYFPSECLTASLSGGENLCPEAGVQKDATTDGASESGSNATMDAAKETSGD